VIAAVRANPGTSGTIPIWNDYGDEDPLLKSDVAFNEAVEAGGVALTAGEWKGGHETSYCDRRWKAYLGLY
jgi:hypothetical protein